MLLFLVYEILVVIISFVFIMFYIKNKDEDAYNKNTFEDIVNGYFGKIENEKFVQMKEYIKTYIQTLNDVLNCILAFSIISIFFVATVFGSSFTLITFPLQVMLFIMYVMKKYENNKTV